MQYARDTRAQWRRMLTRTDALTTCLDAVHSNIMVCKKRMEQTNGIRTTTHAGNQCIRQLARHSQRLSSRFTTNHALKVPH